jgi:heterodisulfide reductase subunit B2
MTIGYYPGCTLKARAKNLESSALAALAALEVEAVELPRWNCCGAVFSLADDDLIHHLAPVRDLIRAKDAGHRQVVTLCSMCYNTLARANLLMRDDAEKRKTINLFMEEETDYAGEVEVLHYLQLLALIGWDKVRAAVKRPLEGLKVAAYYGCTLIRPDAVAIEKPAELHLFDELIRAVGATPVSFAEATTCCSAYQILVHESAALEASATVVRGAAGQGAEVLITSCPVCEYNLGRRQDDARARSPELPKLPTLYFTQLLALALGLPEQSLGLKLNEPMATELLKQKSYLAV